ncbi:MAG: hypothetical protein ACLSDJ_02260 [Butyricimonas faecihominis]
MRIAKIITPIVVFSIFIYCGRKEDNHNFNGKILYFDDSCVITKNVESKSVPLNGAIMSMIAVYDSLLVCWNPNHPDHFFDIFNVDTGEKIGSFCGKGRGFTESISVNCVNQFFKKGDDLMTLLYGSNEGKLFFWNISQSVKKGITVYDTIVPYKNNSISFQFYQSEDTLLIYKASEEVSRTQVTMPFYEKRTIYTNDLIRKFPIYKGDSIENSRVSHPVGTFYYTWDVMKPDGTKIVQVMWQLPQINMIDTQTGDILGYRMKNGPDYSLLKTDMESMNIYYMNVHADDHYIYATYWGKEPWVDRIGVKMPFFNTIHVFDWNGKLCYRLITDQSYLRVWSDSIRNRLYTMNMETEEVFYLDLDELNLN